MTLGDGIFWSIVLILLAVGVYQVSIRKKWQLIGKVFGILVLIGAVIGGGVWGWLIYQNRPVMMTKLMDIELGMAPVEVTLLKGEPDFKGDNTDEEDATDYKSNYFFFGEGEGMLSVNFNGDDQATARVSGVCHSYRYFGLLGVTLNRKESAVIEKLGEPTHESIAADGLMKYISYEPWKVAYEIKEGKVIRLCISESGVVRNSEEYAIPLSAIPE